MKNILQRHSLTILFVLLVCFGCKTSEQNIDTVKNENTEVSSANTNKVESGDESVDVELNVNPELTEGNKLKVLGETNLPNETELLISVESKTTNYKAQDKAIVKDGKFQSSEFSSRVESLEAGQYSLDVTMPIPSTQSESVRKSIGEKGENLKGSLIENGDLGVSISVEKNFQILANGKISFNEDKSQIDETQKRGKEIFKQLSELEKKGREMQSLRNTDDLNKVKDCGNLMRKNREIADDLRNKAEKLPKSLSVKISAVATDLKMCVTCSSSAIESCDRAKSFLNEIRTDIENN